MKEHAMKTAGGCVLAAALVVAFASCDGTDVVARYAGSSFAAAADELGSAMGTEGLTLRIPTGETVHFSPDLAGAADIELSLDAAPFLAAGLDPALLPADPLARWTLEAGRLVGRFDLAGSGSAVPAADPEGLIAAVAAAARDRLGYHAQLGHYGIALGGGNMVEWAADMGKNDKDFVIVLDPGFLRAAGVDAAAVAGWILATVPMDGPDGKPMEAEKLLRPVDLE